MKSQHYLFLLLLYLNFTSCLVLIDPNIEPLNQESIATRWEVSDHENEFSFFEFDLNGNYLVVSGLSLKSTSVLKSFIGDYTIINSNTIELKDFGTIVFQTFNSKDATFTLTLKDAKTGKVIEVVAADKISRSTRTQMLCKAWKREPYSSNDFLFGYKLRLLFSNSGTYFSSIEDPERNSFGALNFWCWNDSLETTICVSPINADICGSNSKFEVLELSNSRLKLKSPESDLIETYFSISSLRE